MNYISPHYCVPHNYIPPFQDLGMPKKTSVLGTGNGTFGRNSTSLNATLVSVLYNLHIILEGHSISFHTHNCLLEGAMKLKFGISILAENHGL